VEGILNLVDDGPVRVRWDPAVEPEQPMANRRVANRRLKELGYRLRHTRLGLP
jgi:hypothetical protein